ncbi:MAG: ATP-binding protein [Muribaculaceae bacterium]|nr:ATP-binding protein [Muribaculaceae bacterium]
MRAHRGKFLIERLIAEGEHECQDFKFTISDARKIARSLSAFANHKGGRLLIGVKDNGTVAGVRSEEDVYMIETAASTYCRPEPEVTFKAYRAGEEGNATVVVAEVARANPEGEMVCVREADGRLCAYVRVADENILAPDLMVRARSAASAMTGMLLTPGGPEMEVLDTLRRLGPSLPEKLLRTVRVSRPAAAAALERLLAIGTVSFTYTPRSGFLLTIPDVDLED